MKFVKACNWLLTRFVMLLLVFTLSFSVYALWSNQRVYADAEGVYNDLLKLKPVMEAGDAPGFSELKAINSDVCGWITLDGTRVDYPILQGETNATYMNQDVYGNFSLAGSIFLDSRNSSQFEDSYSLIYGHHMDNSLMFGDLDLYKDKAFFEANHSATVITETDVKNMTVLAILQIQDSTPEIFEPGMWGSDLSALAEFIQNNAIHIWDPAMEILTKNPTTTQAVALVTCSDGATGNRTVVILICRRDGVNPDRPGGSNPTDTAPVIRPPSKTGDSIYNSPLFWSAALTASLFVLIVIFSIRRRRQFV